MHTQKSSKQQISTGISPALQNLFHQFSNSKSYTDLCLEMRNVPFPLEDQILLEKWVKSLQYWWLECFHSSSNFTKRRIKSTSRISFWNNSNTADGLTIPHQNDIWWRLGDHSPSRRQESVWRGMINPSTKLLWFQEVIPVLDLILLFYSYSTSVLLHGLIITDKPHKLFQIECNLVIKPTFKNYER